MIFIFDWLGDLIGGIGDAIGGLFSGAADAISDWIFDALLQWIYNIIYHGQFVSGGYVFIPDGARLEDILDVDDNMDYC